MHKPTINMRKGTSNQAILSLQVVSAAPGRFAPKPVPPGTIPPGHFAQNKYRYDKLKKQKKKNQFLCDLCKNEADDETGISVVSQSSLFIPPPPK